jgi:hypothetical protein
MVLGNSLRLPFVVVLGFLVALCLLGFTISFSYTSRVESHLVRSIDQMREDYECRVKEIREELKRMRIENREDFKELKRLILLNPINQK